MSSLDLYRQQMTPGDRRRGELDRVDIVDRVLALLRQEWQAGCSGLPGFHHQQQALSRAQVAAALEIVFFQGDNND